MRRAGAAVLAAVLALTLAGCGRQDRPQSGKLNVVCTLFPYYDFVRQIGGDAVDVQLLVPAGRETHSFEPTPLDVIAVSEAEVFIYRRGYPLPAGYDGLRGDIPGGVRRGDAGRP